MKRGAGGNPFGAPTPDGTSEGGRATVPAPLLI